MKTKILLTLSAMIFTFVIPILEINATHVFNTEWPTHAKFHEVWQLFTNTGIGLVCLWLTWYKNNLSMAGVLNMLLVSGVLFAFAMQDYYGGSIKSDRFRDSSTVDVTEPELPRTPTF